MPIEVQIEKTHGKNLPVAETQRLARAYATEQIARQKARLPAPRRARRLGPSVHDDGVSERGRRDPHARQDPREGLSLSRPEAGELVLRLRQRAGRSRGRIRGPRTTSRSTSASRSTTRDRAQARARHSASPQLPDGPVRRRDLDDDAVDDSRQPGAERASRTSTTRWWRRRAGTCVLAQDLVDACLARYKLDGTVVATAKGARARAHRVPPSVLRPRVAGLSRRVRDARAGHRHRPQRRRRTASRTSSRAAATA